MYTENSYMILGNAGGAVARQCSWETNTEGTVHRFPTSLADAS